MMIQIPLLEFCRHHKNKTKRTLIILNLLIVNETEPYEHYFSQVNTTKYRNYSE